MTSTEVRFHLDFYEEKLKDSLSKTMIPERMWPGIINYVMNGIIPGDFLIAVFSNDMIGAYAHADAENERALKDYAKFVYNHTPSSCWGEKNVIKKWNGLGGIIGYYIKQFMS